MGNFIIKKDIIKYNHFENLEHRKLERKIKFGLKKDLKSRIFRNFWIASYSLLQSFVMNNT